MPNAITPAVNDVHEDLAPLISTLARRLARRYRWREEEVEADAYIDFLDAVQTYRPEYGTLEARVSYLIRTRAIDRARAKWEQNRILRPTGADPDTIGRTAHDPEPYSFGRLTARVGADARTVLALLFDGPQELNDIIRADPNPSPAGIRRCLRLWLRDRHGWSHARTLTAFREIEAAV